MKTLIATLLMMSIHFSGVHPTFFPASQPDSLSCPASADDLCTLSITGYGTYEDLGRVEVTVKAEAATCEEAADEIRQEIIRRQIRIRE